MPALEAAVAEATAAVFVAVALVLVLPFVVEVFNVVEAAVLAELHVLL